MATFPIYDDIVWGNFDGDPIAVPADFRQVVLDVYKQDLSLWISDRDFCYGGRDTFSHCGTPGHEAEYDGEVSDDVYGYVWERTCYKYGPENYALMAIALMNADGSPNVQGHTHAVIIRYQHPQTWIAAYGVDINGVAPISCYLN